jgi:arsenate reductase-like glutaredoxin family protein
VELESVNYIEHPLSQEGLKGLLRRAGLKPHDVLRTKESVYREFVAGKDLSHDALLNILAAAVIQEKLTKHDLRGDSLSLSLSLSLVRS